MLKKNNKKNKTNLTTDNKCVYVKFPKIIVLLISALGDATSLPPEVWYFRFGGLTAEEERRFLSGINTREMPDSHNTCNTCT